MVGNSPESLSGSSVPLTLSIDGTEPISLTGYPVGPLVLMRIDDPVLERRVMEAATLRWAFAWGTYTARVDGLGEAFDSIGVCPG